MDFSKDINNYIITLLGGGVLNEKDIENITISELNYANFLINYTDEIKKSKSTLLNYELIKEDNKVNRYYSEIDNIFIRKYLKEETTKINVENLNLIQFIFLNNKTIRVINNTPFIIKVYFNSDNLGDKTLICFRYSDRIFYKDTNNHREIRFTGYKMIPGNILNIPSNDITIYGSTMEETRQYNEYYNKKITPGFLEKEYILLQDFDFYKEIVLKVKEEKTKQKLFHKRNINVDQGKKNDDEIISQFPVNNLNNNNNNKKQEYITEEKKSFDKFNYTKIENQLIVKKSVRNLIINESNLNEKQFSGNNNKILENYIINEIDFLLTQNNEVFLQLLIGNILNTIIYYYKTNSLILTIETKLDILISSKSYEQEKETKNLLKPEILYLVNYLSILIKQINNHILSIYNKDDEISYCLKYKNTTLMNTIFQ